MKLTVCTGPWVVAALCISCDVSGFITRTVSIGLLDRAILTHRHSWNQEAGVRGAAFSGLNKGGLMGEVNVVNMAAGGLSLSSTKDGESSANIRLAFEKVCKDAQLRICKEIEDLDGKSTFKEDTWVRTLKRKSGEKEGRGGGGISRVLSNGGVFEKAGINFSSVRGEIQQDALGAATGEGISKAGGTDPSTSSAMKPFEACGISSVMHPHNPFCPTIHFNCRYFEIDQGVWWFGGGIDITPSYLDEDDIRRFHGALKKVCDKHDQKYYPKFKKWADDYFIIKHRGEARGMGGVFFDNLNEKNPEEYVAFCKDLLATLPEAYCPIIAKHRDDDFTAEEKEWQQIRRGRYVEFNLVYDRGTKFGLMTDGRTESILVSMPQTARWEYGHEPKQGSREENLLKVCRHPRDWV